ncbi:MAG: response regulator [Caldilineaceae bacterium]|nr:response regulator [Caldilineaceae bacterium]
MREVMVKMLMPARFTDPEQARSAQWLTALTFWTFLSVAGYFLVTSLIFWLGIDWLRMVNPAPLTTITWSALLIVIWMLVHQGMLRTAIVITLGVLFIVPTYLNLFVYQTIHSPDVWVYFILIPLTGLLLGRRQMLYFALLILASVAALFYLEVTQILAPQLPVRATATDALLLGISILLSTLLSQATIRKAEAKADEAEQSVKALSESNQQLEQSRCDLQQAHDELEARVAKRTQALRTSNQRLQAEIQERQRLMDALCYSEANWRSLVQNAPELIVTLSTDGTIRFVNQGIGNRTPAQLLNQPITAIHTTSYHQQLLTQATRDVLASGQSVSYESEEQVDEQHTWRINRLGPIYEADEIRSLILVSTDVSEQKQTETAMLQAQKLESLGVMAGGVAHDFNNLLTAMLGQAALAMNKLDAEQSSIREHIQNILLVGHRATDLTRQMLNYAGRSPGELTALDLNRLIQENIHFFSASITKTVAFHHDLAPELPEILGDRGQIQQLIMNLLLNAADAIGEQTGNITMSTTVRSINSSNMPKGDPCLGNWFGSERQAGEYVWLEIADTGCGMDEGTLQKIFDPFFTTKFTGRGLGLASVLGIVRAHNGGIYVSSNVGIGTTFQILFPVMSSLKQKEDDDITAYEPIGLAGKLVLIIDDEDDVRQVTSEILEMSDIRTLNAASGKSGLQIFQQHRNEVDLVLLDLSMPGMSGDEVIQGLRNLRPDVPIVLLSGYDEYEVTRRLGDSCSISFLQKPYNVDGLLQMIEQQLATADHVVTA